MVKVKAASQPSSMIQRKCSQKYVLRDENGIDYAPVQLVYEWERCHPAVGRVDTGITDNRLSSIT